MRVVRLMTVAAVSVFGMFGGAAQAQFGEGPNKGPKLAPDEVIERWQIGVSVRAVEGACSDIEGTVALPGDWPEQQAKIIAEDFSPFINRIDYRMVDNVKQLIVSAPELPAGEEAHALITIDISRHALLPPDDTAGLVKANPKKLPKNMRHYLGPSPGIEIQHAKIKALAKRLAQESAELSDWQKVEALFDWVRDNVQQIDQQKKPGAMQAFKDKQSNHEGMCFLFVALCRASDVPARTVWVPKYCYPEFYLQDADGNGYWFPSQIAGTRSFGGINENRPIWQKGDNFRLPEAPRDPVRYIPPNLTAKGSNPQVEFVRKALGR